MTRVIAALLMLVPMFAVQKLAGAPAPATSPGPVSFEQIVARLEEPPAPYQARRRMEAASTKLNESAWLEAMTEYHPATGFRYSVVAHGGSERIVKRVFRKVLETERETSAGEEWRRGNLSRANYVFQLDGRSGSVLKMRLTPRRRDVRLVSGSALLAAKSGELVRVEGRLSKSPSFWIKWVNVSRTYSPIAGSLMPVSIESTADVRLFGLSTFSMTYDYGMVNGHAVNGTQPPALLVER